MPKISKWDINTNLYNDGMMEGCKLLEKDYEGKNNINEKVICFKGILKHFSAFLSISFFILLTIFFLAMIIFSYFPIFNLCNLDLIRYSSKNPLEYFNLKNHTNITFIARFFNITNLTIIYEQFESEENFINNIINFTFINKGIRVEPELKKYEILSTFLAIVINKNYWLFFAIILNKNLKFINSKIVFLLILSIHFLFIIISLIISFLILKIINKLANSLTIFYSQIEYLFTYNIQPFIWNEVQNLNNTYYYICFNLLLSFFMICLIIILRKDSIKYLPIKRKKSFLDNLLIDGNRL